MLEGIRTPGGPGISRLLRHLPSSSRASAVVASTKEAGTLFALHCSPVIRRVAIQEAAGLAASSSFSSEIWRAGEAEGGGQREGAEQGCSLKR